MLAEAMARAGQALVENIPPDGRAYWSARYWDRDRAEQHPVLAADFLRQKDTIAKYLSTYGATAERSVEFACGTGEFTALTARHTPVREMVALDISAQALEIASTRVHHDNVRFLQGDFWSDHGLEPADLVVCVDAIHHLGDVRAVLQRLREFTKPGGILIGNLFTADNFHEFERRRYGTVTHLWRTGLFFATALMVRSSRGRLYTGSHRTQLLDSARAEQIIADVFPQVVDVSVDPYFTAFVCRA